MCLHRTTRPLGTPRLPWPALLVALLLLSCAPESRPSDGELRDFVQQARAYQRMYMDGGGHCPDLLGMMADSVHFSENGQEWSRAQLEQFCPHLPKKNVVETVDRHRLIAPGVAYDYVAQLYLRERGDTVRESVSRIWRKSDGEWQVVEMNALRERVVPEG